MSGGQILDSNGGVLSEFHYDRSEERAIINTVQDVEPYLERNKQEYHSAPSRFGDVAKVASIPEVIMEKWCNEDGINYMAHENRHLLRKKLNDPDNQFLRTRPGKL